jgi:hypothetical protein
MSIYQTLIKLLATAFLIFHGSQTLLADEFLFAPQHGLRALKDIQHQGLSFKTTKDGLLLHIEKGITGRLSFKESRDFSNWIYLNFQMNSMSSKTFRFDIHLKGNVRKTDWSSKQNFDHQHSGFLRPNEHRDFNCLLTRLYHTKPDYQDYIKIFPSMDTAPNGIKFSIKGLDPKGLQRVELVFPADAQTPTRKLLIKSISFKRPIQHPVYSKNKKDFFPFVDAYGQFIHDDWKGKLKDESDFQTSIQNEDLYLKQYPGPQNRNKYGSDLDGPRFKASGRFRVQKRAERWYLVDPDGYHHWSVGVNFVGRSLAHTKIKDREHFFKGLPPTKMGRGAYWYNDKRFFNHGEANIYSKYGSHDTEAYEKRCIKRLKSWGFNTLGGWSVDTVGQFEEQHKLPYTLFFDLPWKLPGPKINSKLQDIYNPKWKKQLKAEFETRAHKFKDDPFLIGVFVNNEMHWETPQKFAKQVLSKGRNTPGKTKYVHFLKNELKTLKQLNKRLKSSYASWDEIIADTKAGQHNLSAISELNKNYYINMCEDYFTTIRAMMDQYFPDVLYLGCRWFPAQTNREVVEIGAKYIDLLSFNRYANDASGFKFPSGLEKLDKPFLISEFHFGALDRGVFSPGLNYAADQRNKGERYSIYVDTALELKKCVGAHWFMMADESISGHAERENFNCGLLSITDEPYYDFIDIVRKYNYQLYNKLRPLLKP